MQAIVLVGGEGTRLRPLTSTVPKPALTLVDRPFLAYMIEWLARHGVEEVILACGFLPDVLREALGEGERAGARIRYVVEPEPLGTAGAIRFAADELGEELGERFLALNGDVLTDLDLERAAARPRGAGGAARPSACTRSRTPPPTAWSAAARSGEVLEFLEKTGERGAGGGQRRHVRARALGPRPDPAGRGRLDRARRLPAPGRRGAPRRCCSRATGWTSAPRSATCRRPGTSSRGGSRPGRADRARGCYVDPAAEIAGAPSVGPRAVIGAAAAGSSPGRRSASRSCSTAAWSGRAPGRGSILAAGRRRSRPGAALEGAVVGRG